MTSDILQEDRDLRQNQMPSSLSRGSGYYPQGEDDDTDYYGEE